MGRHESAASEKVAPSTAQLLSSSSAADEVAPSPEQLNPTFTVLTSVAPAEQLEHTTSTMDSLTSDQTAAVDLASAVESPRTFSVEIPLPAITPIAELASIAVPPPLEVSFPPLPELTPDTGIALPTSVVDPAAIPLSLSQPAVALHNDLSSIASHEQDAATPLDPSEALPAIDPMLVDSGLVEEQAHGVPAIEQSPEAAHLEAASFDVDPVAASDSDADALHLAQHAEWEAQGAADLAQEQAAAEQAAAEQTAAELAVAEETAVEQTAVVAEAQAAEAEQQAHELDAAADVDAASAVAACEIPADTPIL